MKKLAITGALVALSAFSLHAIAKDGEPGHPTMKAPGQKPPMAKDEKGVRAHGSGHPPEGPAPAMSGAPDASAAAAASAAPSASAAVDAVKTMAKGPGKGRHGTTLAAFKDARRALLAEEKAEREAFRASLEKMSPDERKAALDARKAKLKELHDARKKQLDELRQSLESTTEPSLSEEEKAKVKKKLEEGAEKRREARKAKAKEEREALEKRLGKGLEDEENRSRVREHAWRIARLNALVEVAIVREKPELKAKAEKLIASENERFEKLAAEIAAQNGATP